ncbi:MAG: hypothetical protein ACREVO_13210 [Steroidobacteraceae bacterium]
MRTFARGGALQLHGDLGQPPVMLRKFFAVHTQVRGVLSERQSLGESRGDTVGWVHADISADISLAIKSFVFIVIISGADREQDFDEGTQGRGEPLVPVPDGICPDVGFGTCPAKRLEAVSRHALGDHDLRQQRYTDADRAAGLEL